MATVTASGRPRDSQRAKVYRLPHTYGDGRKESTLSLIQCEALTAAAYERYGLTWRGRVTDGRGTRRATGSAWRVSLPTWSRHAGTVLHEAAHGITDTLYGTHLAAHGPEFARVMLELWAWHKLDTLPNLRAAARREKVRVAASGACIPPKAGATRELEKAKARLKLALAEYEAAKKAVDNARAKLRA